MGLYILESYRGTPVLTKAAMGLLTAAIYMGWYSYCTTSWGRTFPSSDTDYFVGYGVWRVADNQFKNTDPTSATGSNAPVPLIYFHTDGWLLAWYGAFQALASFGFLSLNLGYFLIVLFVYVGPCKSNLDLAFWNAINNIFGSICWLIAVILFAVKFKDTFAAATDHADAALQYSFILAVVVVACQLLAGILLLLTKRDGGAVDNSS